MPGFRHSDTERFYEYWRSLADGKPPHFRLWDPIQIPKLMPNLLILEANADNDFVYRFAGTAVCDFVGEELTGRLMKDFFPSPEAYATVENVHRTLLEVPCGQLASYLLRTTSGRESISEIVILPMCGADGVPDRLVVCMAILEEYGFGDSTPEVSQNLSAEWIDLGFGVPELLSAGELVS